MTDIVWIELTREEDETRQSFMFGPTGIVSFVPNSQGQTLLFGANGNPNPTIVLESASDIFSVIAKIRGTVGALDKQNKKTKSKKK